MKLHKYLISRFNMVEVALALAVVGLGVTGIMSLFPVGINSAKDAIGDNYAADSADQLLHYMARVCDENWDTMIWDTVGNTDTGLPQAPPSISVGDVQSDWGTATSGNIYDASKTGVTNVYGIKQKSGDVEDFVAHIKIWKSPIVVMDTTPPRTIPFSIAAALNIEISWPVGKPYAQRTKRHYYYEIYNKN